MNSSRVLVATLKAFSSTGLRNFARWALVLALVVILSGSFLYLPLQVWLAMVAVVGLLCWRPETGLLSCFLLITLDTETRIPGEIVLWSSEILLAAALVCRAWRLLVPGEEPGEVILGRLKTEFLSACPFVFVVLVSSASNLGWVKALPHTARFCGFAAALLLASSIPHRGVRSRNVRILLYGLVVIHFGVSISGLLREGTPAAGFFANSNQFAALLSLLLPFFAAIALFETRGKLRVLPWLAVTGSILMMGLLEARTALLTSLLVLALLGFRWSGRSRKSPGHRLSPLAAALLLGLPVGGIILGALLFVGGGSEVTSPSRYVTELSKGVRLRLELFQVGLAMWKDHPLLGVGPTGYQDLFGRYNGELIRKQTEFWSEIYTRAYPEAPAVAERMVNDRIREVLRSGRVHSHSTPIQLLASFGLFGTAAFLFWLGHWFRTGLHAAEPDRTIILAVLLGGICVNLVDVTLPSLGLEIGMILGLAQSDTRRD